MGNTMKIATGLGVLAGISYFGRKRMDTAKVSAKAGGIVGYIRGLTRGFTSGIKATLKRRIRSI